MSSNRQLDSLTGIRGISAMMVVITHAVSHPRKPSEPKLGYTNSPDSFDIANSFFSSGLMSVYFFFALSGFLLTYRAYCEMVPTNKAKAVTKENPANYDTKVPHPDLHMPTTWSMLYYVIRRIFRIYPAYLVVLTLCEDNPYPTFWTERFWKRLFLLNTSYAHFWTIRVEFAYYMLIPVLQMICALSMKFENYLASINKRVPLHSIHLIAIGFITGIAIWVHATGFIYIPYDTLKVPVYQNFPVFWYGSLAGTAYFYLKRHGYTMGKPKGKRQLFFFYAAEVITYAMIVIVSFANKPTSMGYFGKLIGLSTCSFASLIPFVCILILVLAITQDQTSLGKAFSSSWLLWIGKTSYSIYLINYTPINLVFDGLGLRGVEALVLTMVIEAWLGWLLHFLVEDRGVLLGNKLIKKIKDTYQHPKKKAKISLDVTQDNSPFPLNGKNIIKSEREQSSEQAIIQIHEVKSDESKKPSSTESLNTQAPQQQSNAKVAA